MAQSQRKASSVQLIQAYRPDRGSELKNTMENITALNMLLTHDFYTSVNFETCNSKPIVAEKTDLKSTFIPSWNDDSPADMSLGFQVLFLMHLIMSRSIRCPFSSKTDQIAF